MIKVLRRRTPIIPKSRFGTIHSETKLKPTKTPLPRPMFATVSAVALGGTIGVGLFFVFRTKEKSEVALRKDRIEAFKSSLLEKKTLPNPPKQQLPRFEGLFPEYDTTFKTSASTLIVEGPPGIGKTAKTIELLQGYKGPVFFCNFPVTGGDATQAVCDAAGVKDIWEFTEGLREAEREAGAQVVVALDDVNKGYGENAVIKNIALLLSNLRMMSTRGLYTSSERNIIHLIQEDDSNTVLISLKPADDAAMRNYIKTNLRVDDAEAVAKWVDHFDGCLAMLLHVAGSREKFAEIAADKIHMDLILCETAIGAACNVGPKKDIVELLKWSLQGDVPWPREGPMSNAANLLRDKNILREAEFRVAPHRRQMRRAIEAYLKEEKEKAKWF